MMSRSRRGFSLMEVMLATSILLGSSIVLIELATIGRKQANSAYDLNTAQLLCQAKLNELVAKTVSVKPIQEEEFEDNPGWFYSIEIEPARHRRLVSVKVTVSQEADETRRSSSFSLVRWLPDSILDSKDGLTSSGSRGARETREEGDSFGSRPSSADNGPMNSSPPNSRGTPSENSMNGPRRNSRREGSP